MFVFTNKPAHVSGTFQKAHFFFFKPLFKPNLPRKNKTSRAPSSSAFRVGCRKRRKGTHQHCGQFRDETTCLYWVSDERAGTSSADEPGESGRWQSSGAESVRKQETGSPGQPCSLPATPTCPPGLLQQDTGPSGLCSLTRLGVVSGNPASWGCS